MFELQVQDHMGRWALIARGSRDRMIECRQQDMAFSGRWFDLYRIVKDQGAL